MKIKFIYSFSKIVAFLLLAGLVMTFSPQTCLADIFPATPGELVPGAYWSGTGTFLTGGGGGIFATDGWDSTLTILDWDIKWDDPFIEYNYAFTIPEEPQEKNLSHIILQLSENFTSSDISSIVATSLQPGNEWEIGTFSPGGSNPGMPGSIYGIKFNTADGFDQTEWEVTFKSTRFPMWGNFYTKGGTFNYGALDVYAYNTGFDPGYTGPGPGAFIPVPDTVIPVPGAVLLGILGLGVAGWKLRKYE